MMLAVSCANWRVSTWVDRCCRQKKRSGADNEKVEHLCQGPFCHVRPSDMAWNREDLAHQDDILIQPSPTGSAIFVRRVSSAPVMSRKAGDDMAAPVTEGAELLQGNSEREDLPAPP